MTHRHADLHSLMTDLDNEDLKRLDYLLRHPDSALFIFRQIKSCGGGRVMFRSLVDRSMSIELDFEKAMAMPMGGCIAGFIAASKPVKRERKLRVRDLPR